MRSTIKSRPDQNTNLVSYPYYAKYQKGGDRTFFRHLDTNIKNLALKERGACHDLDAYNTAWTPQPCQSTQVRITVPHLPHGAQGPAKRDRRTMLPWYVALQNDLKSLFMSPRLGPGACCPRHTAS